MKYEMIFGDEGLFDGAPEDAEMAASVCQMPRWYTMFNGKVLFCDSKKESWRSADFNHPGSQLLAMRRIIEEPKRWTWEDKKAGRLPEVGSLIMEVESQYGFEFVGVCAGSKRFAVKDVLDGLIYFYNKDVISPIETPAEKAQREEDEFVNNVSKEASRRMTETDLGFYTDGIRAAYRKLKITEVE